MRILSAGAAKPSSTALVAGGAKIESGGSSGGGGGGATVNAINKTGAVLNEGDKVWLNQYSQEAGNKLEFTTQYALTTVSRDGDFVMTNQTASASPMTIYSADGDLSLSTVTSINQQAGRIGTVKYGPDNSMFLLPISGQGGTSRIDGEKQWTNTTYWYQGDNIFSYQNSSTYEYYKIDLETGNILKTYVATDGSTYQSIPYGAVFLKGRIYSGAYYFGYKYYTLDDEAGQAVPTGYSLGNGGNAGYSFLSVTSDEKFIIGFSNWSSAQGAFANFTSSTGLRLISVVGYNLTIMPQTEMPQDMQRWYDKACFIVFNPYTGILTCTEKLGTDYGVYKYNGDKWETLIIDLEGVFTSKFNKFTSGLVVSDNLSRCAVAVGDTINGYRGRVINLTTIKGYTANSYKAYLVNNETITGYAKSEAEANQEVKVNIASK